MVRRPRPFRSQLATVPSLSVVTTQPVTPWCSLPSACLASSSLPSSHLALASPSSCKDFLSAGHYGLSRTLDTVCPYPFPSSLHFRLFSISIVCTHYELIYLGPSNSQAEQRRMCLMSLICWSFRTRLLAPVEFDDGDVTARRHTTCGNMSTVFRRDHASFQ